MRRLIIIGAVTVVAWAGVASAAGKKKQKASDDLDLDLDTPSAPAKPKGGDDLDLDLDTPPTPKAKPAAKKPPAGDLDLDLDGAPRPAQKPEKTDKKSKKGKPAGDLDLDLDAPVPAAKKAAPSLDLDLDLDLDTPVAKPTPVAPTKPKAPEVPKAPLAPTPAPQVKPPQDEGDELASDLESDGTFHRWEFGLKVGGILFSGRTDAVLADGAAPSASRGISVPGLLEARVRPSADLPELALFLEAGFFPKTQVVQRSLAYDPDFKDTTGTYSLVSIPLELGLGWDLPQLFDVYELGLALRVAGLGQYVRSSSTWTTGGVAVSTAAQTGFALGWVVGGELTWLAGPGAIVVDVRYGQAFTDLGLPAAYAAQGAQAQQPYNRSGKGDVHGTNVLAGYRFLL